MQEELVEVKVEARLFKINAKLATEYLMYHRRKTIKMRQEEQMMLAQDKAKNDAMAAKAQLIPSTLKKENRLTIWDNWLK
jgi:hypothetical protein